jgi:N-acetylneuraminic acid mutarotase
LVYTLGGFTPDPCGRFPVSVTSMEAYNPDTDVWQSSTPMLSPRADFGAVVANGTLYAIGGENDYVSPPDDCSGGIYGYPISSVEAYSFTTHSWRYVASLPTPAAIRGAVVGADGRVYVLAFPNQTGPYGQGVVYAYNTTKNKWVTIGSAPSGAGPMTVVGPNRELLVLVGDYGSGHLKAQAFTRPT